MALANAPAVRRRRTYAGEEAWFPLLEEFGLRRLRRAFIACGVQPQVAACLVFFLEDQVQLDRHFSPNTGVKYRELLRALNREDVAAAARAIPG